jgi:Pyruvate/2-oxoacid:ferredoxin oxidoreductase delta subunit
VFIESFFVMVKHMDDGFSVSEQCFACVAWCPGQAIDFRSSTVERRRYHNPEISISDMVVVDSGSKYHVNLVP